ncbi:MULTISPECIES: TRAP transporter small permease subunit [unclassified Martelella]|uniref:TRAP transporter small permease subunit n=1 Tax=unclassified Martelella TaxID=2629616 RepID=UPI0025C67FE1|nr:TRAP transporter small permease [Martelella sp.]
MTGSPEASTPQTSEKLPLPIRLIDGLSGLSAALAAAGLVLLALNVFLDVLGRTFLHRAIPGTIDMTINWWMPMLALLAFGYTEKMQDHIKVTVLLDSLPIGLRRAIEGIFSLLAAVLLMFLAFYTWVDAARSAKIGETTSSSPPVMIWPFKFVAVAGVIVLSLQLLATAWRHFSSRLPREIDFDVDEAAL